MEMGGSGKDGRRWVEVSELGGINQKAPSLFHKPHNRIHVL